MTGPDDRSHAPSDGPGSPGTPHGPEGAARRMMPIHAPDGLPRDPPTTPPTTPTTWHAVPDDGTGDEAGPADPMGARTGGWPQFWNIVFIIDAAFIGLNILVSAIFLVLSLVGAVDGQDVAGGDLTERFLWANVVLIAVMFGILPVAWLLGTRVAPVAGTRRFLHLDRFWPDAGWGVVVAFGLLAALVVIGLVLQLFGFRADDQAVFPSGMSWYLVVALAVVPGICEEVFFRGVAQRYTGVWGQAALFAAPHLYEGVLAVFLIFGVGLVLGYLIKRGLSLYTTMVAHTLFNLAQLSLLKLGPSGT